MQGRKYEVRIGRIFSGNLIVKSDKTMTASSLISRDASAAIKGLLMLLIVFGHTGLLTTDFATGERTFLWYWLYTFHVYVFLILPFIYGYHRDSKIEVECVKFIDLQCVKNDLKRNLLKLGAPYCWFFLLSAIVFVTVGGGIFDLGGMLYAFVFGNEPLMDKYVGFNFIWFLPSIFALTMLKSVWYNSRKPVRITILAVSIVLWVLAFCKVITRFKVGMFVPFGIAQAFYFVLLGITARWILEKREVTNGLMAILIFVVFGLTLLLYFQKRLQPHCFVSISQGIYFCMPVAIFLILYGIRDILARSKFLKFIGIYSLQIYLVHVYVVNILSVLLLRFFPQSISLGVVVYVLTLAISIGCALLMTKCKWLNRILFPKG